MSVKTSPLVPPPEKRLEGFVDPFKSAFACNESGPKLAGHETCHTCWSCWSVQTKKSEHPTSLEVTVLSRSAEVKSPPTLKLPATVQAASNMVDSSGNASKSRYHSITTSNVAPCESQVLHNLHTARGSMPQATHIQKESISTSNLDICSLLGIPMDTAGKLHTGSLHSRLNCFHRMFQRSH